MKKTLLLIFVILFNTATVAEATTNITYPTDKNPAPLFYIVVNGMELYFGSSREHVLELFGTPDEDQQQTLAWRFGNGMSLIVGFDKEGLSEATISSSDTPKESYALVYGKKITLNKLTLTELENRYQDAYRCLTYYEQDGLGWLDYDVRDGQGKDHYATFSALNHSKFSLQSLEGQIATKDSLVDSITIHKQKENFSNIIYCKEWYQR